tara:strand:+ start:23454 stop:23843 length:390 start_codon:yes stop_codon:yes gene_type:complete
MVVERNKVGTIDGGGVSAAATLPVGSPLAFDTTVGGWVPYTQGGANGSGVIAGFVAHQSVLVDATDDVQCTIMLAGEVHADDVNTLIIRTANALASGAAITEGNLTAALKLSSLRDKQLHVRGLSVVEG